MRLCAAGPFTLLVMLAASAAPAAPLDGVWRTAGYGTLIEIDGTRARFHAVSPVAIVPSFTGRLRGERIDIDAGPAGKLAGTLRREGDEVVLTLDETVIRRAQRLDSFPARPPRVERSRDPGLVFDVLWSTFDAEYAFFSERGIDWAARRGILRARAVAAPDNEALFAVLVDLLTPLGDGHVSLIGGNAKRAWQAGTPPPWSDEARRAIDVIKERYLTGPPERRAGRKLAYGRLRGGVGYLVLTAMTGFADTFEAEVRALDDGLDAALTAQGDAPALVLDLRFNGGGADAHALRVAGRFANERRVAFTRRAREGDGWSPEQTFHVEPSQRRCWSKRLYVLTSGYTASAAETCVLALSTHPNVVRVGERTQGIFSDMHFRPLPNGWTFTLSNEQYRDGAGVCHETRGLAPEISAPMDVEAAREGRDPALEAVLAHLAAPASAQRP